MFENVDWSEAEAHIREQGRITTMQADEALADQRRLVIEPDYASKSGLSVRIIGYAPSIGTLLSVIVLVHEGREYGVNGWPSNEKDITLYREAGE